MNDDVDERLKLHYVYTGRDSQTYLDLYILGMQLDPFQENLEISILFNIKHHISLSLLQKLRL